MNFRHAFKDLLGLCRDTDAHIAANIKRFRNSLNPEVVAAAKRPANFNHHIEIVIPCYNHGPFLQEAMLSIKKQTVHPKKLTVTFVDDCSQDNSLEIMRTISKRLKESWMQVNVLHNVRNLNQAGSINRAIKESNAQLFVMLNADDMLTPDCLETILATYKKYPDIYLLGGSSLWFEKSSALPKHHKKNVEEMELSIYSPDNALDFTSLTSLNMSQSSCSFLRVAWETVGGYFERRDRVCSFDDRDFQMRVCSVFPVGVYVDYPMEFYRTTSSTGKGTI